MSGEMPAHGPLVFTPGPTALHPLVADEMAAAARDGFLSASHRSPRFRAEVERTTTALLELLGAPPDHRVLFTGSATEAMERLVAGTVRERSFHLVNGAFARRFRVIAARLGKEATAQKVADGASFGADEPGPEAAELLALTQNETSTGARIPPEVVHRLAERARAAGALVAADLVTGWPIEAVLPDRIDAGFFSVQKAFGMPAGLGVIVAGPALVDRARRLEAEGAPVGGYLHLPAMIDAAEHHETVATPNMLLIRVLGRVAEAYLADGISALRNRTEEKAGAIWAAVDAAALIPFVADPHVRSRTILVVDAGERASSIRDELREAGFLVGAGYGRWKDRHLRIANFPVQTPEMVEALAGAIGGR